MTNRSDKAALRRAQLDRTLLRVRHLKITRPKDGWIPEVRKSLGMNTSQFGKRLGIKQQSAVDLENSERKGTITLQTLNRAAEALDCDLVYALVPRKGLEVTLNKRAEKLVDRLRKEVDQTMALEAQKTTSKNKDAERRLIEKLISKLDSRLWNDEK